ncbi:hypothetical protein CEY12_13630 [Chryseobacterium sp. T16E-39]|uniref:rhodanese-like domain-containing protein n=1 Tax=Chryseobacterium sp. T16E-39 TaxID=2015076 RepID=UPI000B5B249B|nr:rhodanese-like domain-containing protein [Chryseobacterium sp. T16E-39]ASK31084.1 hypothetical protein CEY12_13630 [Chryseobacterium sp. T16E-39]
MRNQIWGFIFVTSALLSACKTSTTATAQNNALPNIKEVVNSNDVTLVDVRVPEQYKEGTAKNAINIPLADIQSNIGSLKGKKVVVFCNKGIQADQAVQILKKNGVDVYDGTSWKNVKAIQEENAAPK